MAAKILYISHYEEPSGWGEAARNYILAMDSVGVDIVIRSIRPNKSGPAVKLSKRFQELAAKPLDGCNICIQNLLPHLMDYNGNFDKNIGQFVTETNDWYHCGWHDYLNQMDEVWVPNFDMLFNLPNNRVKVKGQLVPHACDITKYTKKYDKLEIPNTEGNFKFYFIGEHNRRKHISALIRAYFMTFTNNDPVSLVLKVNKHGMNPQQIYSDIVKIANDIKQSHKLYLQDRYPHIAIVPTYMDSNDINKLHTTCDCFVNPSFGEAWSIPTFDAMGFNKYIVTNWCGGPSDFLINYPNAVSIKNSIIPVFGMTETFPQMNSAKESWHSIDINDLSNSMREVMNMKLIQSNNYKHYSYEAIGNTIKGLLQIS